MLTLFKTIGLLSMYIALVPGIQAAEFIPLGDLEGGSFSSSAVDVSYDGSVVVGRASSASGNEAYRWTAETGMVVLDWIPGGWYHEVTGISEDGSAVVGYGRSVELGNFEASRWTSDQGTIGLGSIHSIISSNASAVSADGKVVVGKSIAPGAPPGQGRNHTEAYLWTSSGGMVGLGDLPDHRLWSNAYGVSADGSVVVGSGNIGSENFQEAFRWTEVGGMVGLGDLAGGGFGSDAYNVSGDGSVVVGSSDIELGVEAFRWTDASGMVGLGDLPGGEFRSEATGVSGDGNVVVGNSQSGFGNEFFVWTEANGMQRLQGVLEANGTTGLSGWSGLSAGGISGNGQWVAGQGTNPSGFQEAFLAQLPTNINLDFEINAGHAGAWYNTATSGQGQLIDVEPENQFIFLSWFTYTDTVSSSPNQQHWFTAQGNYTGSNAELVLYETLGGQLDGPQEVSTAPVGSVNLSFSDCTAGTLSYTVDTWGLQGSFPLSRAIPGTENVCLERSGSDSDPLDSNDGWDGAWYDKNSPGQGFLIDALASTEGDDFIFVAWFTYGQDSTSGQRWLTAQGPLQGTMADLVVYETTGGSFDKPITDETNPVGSMTIEFTDCSHGSLTYSLADEGLAGNIQIERAIPGTEALCQEINGQNN